MREKVFQFGENKSLVGIVTYPHPIVEGYNRPAIILLNSGLIHRVGPNRNYVKIARTLASDGFVVLRFDHSGVGDSKIRSDNLPFEKSSIIETQEAMDFLTKVSGVQRFILMGICSGAFTAFEVACIDSRVMGIVPVDYFGASSIRYQIHMYIRRLLNLRSWGKLITGKSDILGILRRFVKNKIVLQTEWRPNLFKGDSQISIKEKLIAKFHLLTQRGVNVCLIYSSGSPAYYNYCLLLKDGVHSFGSNEQLQVIYLKTADHLFTLFYIQEILIKIIREWVQKLVQNEMNSQKV